MANNTNLTTSIDEALLERNVLTDIWDQAIDQAVIPGLTKSVPVKFGENSIPTVTKRPSASMPGEGQGGAASQFGMGAEKFSAHRAQVITAVSNELLESDPASAVELVQSETIAALSRQIDQAISLGTVAATGTSIAGVKFLNQVTGRSILDATTDVDQLLEDIIGELLEAGVEPSAALVDRGLLYRLATAKDKQGRKLHPEIDALAKETTLQGLHAVSSRVISGRGEDFGTDNGVRALIGNFESVRFGFNTNIKFEAIEYGDPDGSGVDLKNREATAFKAICRFGWGIPDLGQFRAIDLAPVAP